MGLIILPIINGIIEYTENQRLDNSNFFNHSRASPDHHTLVFLSGVIVSSNTAPPGHSCQLGPDGLVYSHVVVSSSNVIHSDLLVGAS